MVFKEKKAITCNKKRIPLFYSPAKWLSATSSPQILSINEDIAFLNVMNGLCGSSDNADLGQFHVNNTITRYFIKKIINH